MATAPKPIKYFVAFLLCAIGLASISLVLSGRVATFLEAFAFHGGGLILFYYGNKLGWLTWDPDIEKRPAQKRDRQTQAIRQRIARKMAEEEQRTLRR